MCTASELIDRVFGALAQENVNVLPIAQASSECTLSYLVARKDMKAALVTTHRELQLGQLDSQPLAISSFTSMSGLAPMPIEQLVSYHTSLMVLGL